MMTPEELRQRIVDHAVADDKDHQTIVQVMDQFVIDHPDGDFAAIRRLVVNHAETTDASHQRLVKALDRLLEQQ